MTLQEQLADAAKTAPPITVAGLTVAGLPISDWVLMLTALYTLLQVVFLVRRLIASKNRYDATCIKDCPNRTRK